MSTFRQLTLGALSLLTVATAAGCGTAGVNTLVSPQMTASSSNTIFAAGTVRKLGYSIDRYNSVVSRTAHPQHLRRQGMLPASADNRQFCSPVADQGQLGSCTAFSMVKGMREYLENKSGQRAFTELSPLFFYYEERAKEGTISQDSGATISDGMSVLKDTGVCPESDDPYVISHFTQKPSAKAVSDAGAFKVKSTTQLAALDDVKSAIAAGGVVSFGFVVYSSFEDIGSDGVMAMPKKGEQVLGGHAVLAVGYDDAKQALIVRNSWGSGWGDKGYFYMPYQYYTGKVGRQANVMEAWTASL